MIQGHTQNYRVVVGVEKIRWLRIRKSICEPLQLTAQGGTVPLGPLFFEILYLPLITPRAHARARGYVIGCGVYYILYIYISARTFFYLSKYSLSDAHFSTGRLLFEFNRLQYTLAAPEVFASSANPVILPSGYRVSIVRNTNIDQIETTPLR